METNTTHADISSTFLEMLGVTKDELTQVVADALSGAEDGELFLERSETEALVLSDGRIEEVSFDTDEGFGLRRVEGTETGYVSDQNISIDAIRQAGDDLRAVFASGKTFFAAGAPAGESLYSQERPADIPLPEKIALLSEVDAYIRSLDVRAKAVNASFVSQLREVCIVRPDGLFVSELRPLVVLKMQVVLKDGEQSGTGYEGFGGRHNPRKVFGSANWKPYADRAVYFAQALLEAEECPAGEMDVVLGRGWPGVILHEAFGHMTEGDFNFKGVGAFADMTGERVASELVTIVDEGNISERRGSLSFDDEGTPTQRTVLVKDGVLVSYMHDRLSARMLSAKPTGNGRRESYEYSPMPRMTNTHMLGGQHSHEEIIRATKNGLYVEAIGGGQVDITSGKFVFRVSLARRIEDGKLTVPIKGATLIGSGPKVFLSVDMVGNDPALDNGVGVCGKNGQGVPVGVGQPTIRVRKGGLVVGGTQMS
ncbi:MAG: metalloprotease TldD [Parcubacteria group bacterium]|nr:metalloprotease TldD [Parcubacteria group bacterium]